jgi:hypothetical protein
MWRAAQVGAPAAAPELALQPHPGRRDDGVRPDDLRLDGSQITGALNEPAEQGLGLHLGEPGLCCFLVMVLMGDVGKYCKSSDCGGTG